jgi:hypothetical protein
LVADRAVLSFAALSCDAWVAGLGADRTALCFAASGAVEAPGSVSATFGSVRKMAPAAAAIIVAAERFRLAKFRDMVLSGIITTNAPYAIDPHYRQQF